MSFIAPKWDTDTAGDEMHKNLFQKMPKISVKQRKPRKKPSDNEKIKSAITKSKDVLSKARNFKKFRKLNDNINEFIHNDKEKLIKNKNIRKRNVIKDNNINKKSKEKLQKFKNSNIVKTLNGNKKILTSKKAQNYSKVKTISKSNETNADDVKLNSPNKQREKRLKKKLKRLQNRQILEKNDKNVPVTKKKVLGLNLDKLKETLKPASKISSNLRKRMLEQLKASRFRYINEQIYTTDSKEAQKLFKSDPEAFISYHEGYKQQIARWPLNPLDRIINSIKKLPDKLVIADFGCGEAKLAQSVPQKVHSFDLVSTNPSVIACDMAHCPLQKHSIDVAVFCLSLMGTNLKDYLVEANRVLKIGGILKIAEVESRFEGVQTFIEGVQRFGFTNTWKDLSHNLFYFLDFQKDRNIKRKNKLPTISLHPCLYKKR